MTLKRNDEHFLIYWEYSMLDSKWSQIFAEKLECGNETKHYI